jgi:C-methyltransferase C-terminal domain/Putative zinc binding domain/Methyltransferase domain
MPTTKDAVELASATSATPGGPRCRLCAASLSRTFVDLGMSPLANAYLRPQQMNSMEPFFPLRVWICDSCLLVQVPEFESPENIFADYAYFSSFSETWLRHIERYSDAVVQRFGLGASTKVVEIASNDGYLLQYFKKRGMPVLGVEPANNVAEVARQKGIPTVSVFFGTKTARDLADREGKAGLLVANNVLPHVPDLNDFIGGLKILLGPQGILTMEFGYLITLMDKNEFDTIYHEHFSYFSFLSVQDALSRHGLTVFDVEQLPTHGGALRVYVRHHEDASKPVGPRVQELSAHERQRGVDRLPFYESFPEQVRETKRKLLEFLIKAKRQNKRIAGYGAPAKGVTLLNYCGVATDFLDYTVDINPAKQGRFLPGVRIPIYAPDKLRETKPDYVLILPWNLRDEVVSQMSDIRSWGGKFVVPIPEVQVLP